VIALRLPVAQNVFSNTLLRRERSRRFSGVPTLAFSMRDTLSVHTNSPTQAGNFIGDQPRHADWRTYVFVVRLSSGMEQTDANGESLWQPTAS
jgi:hypothetical protein